MARTTCGECIFSTATTDADWSETDHVMCKVAPTPVYKRHTDWCGAGRARNPPQADSSWLWWWVLGIFAGVCWASFWWGV